MISLFVNAQRPELAENLQSHPRCLFQLTQHDVCLVDWVPVAVSRRFLMTIIIIIYIMIIILARHVRTVAS